ncbi:hypothetical protein JKP88DRAFT_250623 [Tribonema minus]|uniref:Uncharacterized protein n=1 Tax=Tribonema minus TaxID=303371 RepID=A0A836CR61_9STRA|nr:hypothetical protein JKP88DRAFT_250623 [Tribonema minus]
MAAFQQVFWQVAGEIDPLFNALDAPIDPRAVQKLRAMADREQGCTEDPTPPHGWLEPAVHNYLQPYIQQRRGDDGAVRWVLANSAHAKCLCDIITPEGDVSDKIDRDSVYLVTTQVPKALANLEYLAAFYNQMHHRSEFTERSKVCAMGHAKFAIFREAAIAAGWPGASWPGEYPLRDLAFNFAYSHNINQSLRGQTMQLLDQDGRLKTGLRRRLLYWQYLRLVSNINTHKVLDDRSHSNYVDMYECTRRQPEFISSAVLAMQRQFPES